MEGPSPGFDYVNFGVRLLLQQSFLGRKMDPEINRTRDWVNLRAEISSDSKLCHDPEGGDSDQPLVGDEKNFRLAQVNEPTLQGRGDGLGTVGHSELAENVIDMTLNRRFANRQTGADFLIALTSHDQLEHFHLPAG